MILRIFTCLICLSFSSVFAQITITTAHMPKSGDTIRYSVALMSDLPDLKKTGADHVWDYKSLGLISQDISEFKASGSTPYILSFGFTAIGLKIADTIGTGQIQLKNVYNFFKNNSTGYEGVGIGFTYSSLPLPQAGKHSDPDEIFTFPLTYNSNKTTTFKVAVPIVLGILPVGNFFQQGTRQTFVDGWGKISTPYASNVECIRVKSIINSNDSLAITTPAINFGIPTKRIEYKWLSTTERIPLLEIVGTELAGTFTPTYIRYRDNYRSSSTTTDIDELQRNFFSIYPNPFTSQIKIIGDPLSYQLIDTKGTVITAGMLGPEVTIDTENLDLGIYFIHLKFASGNIKTIKLAKLTPY